jgi:hypothetical protein
MVVLDNFEITTEEEKRLKEDRDRTKYWKKWGPYVSERVLVWPVRPPPPTGAQSGRLAARSWPSSRARPGGLCVVRRHVTGYRASQMGRTAPLSG